MLRLCVCQVAECSAKASVQLSQFNHDAASIDTFVKQCGNAALTAASLLTLKSVRHPPVNLLHITQIQLHTHNAAPSCTHNATCNNHDLRHSVSISFSHYLSSLSPLKPLWPPLLLALFLGTSL